MRSRTLAIALATPLATAVAACLHVADPEDRSAPERDRAQVVLPIPRRDAEDRLYAAFRTESLTVARVDGSRFESSPLVHTSFRLRRVYTYSATVDAESDTASRVTLWATAHDALLGMPDEEGGPATPETRGDAITSRALGTDAAAWQRLKRIAAAIRTAPGAPTH